MVEGPWAVTSPKTGRAETGGLFRADKCSASAARRTRTRGHHQERSPPDGHDHASPPRTAARARSDHAALSRGGPQPCEARNRDVRHDVRDLDSYIDWASARAMMPSDEVLVRIVEHALAGTSRRMRLGRTSEPNSFTGAR